MIQKFVDNFMARKDILEAQFKEEHPYSYQAIVKAVVELIKDDKYDFPDPNRIHVIDDGDWQGTLLFVIAAGGYQPWDYWYVKVSYGSCSGCDTLQGIRGYDDEKPNESQVKDYMTLALHIVQRMKSMQENDDED